MRTSRHPSVGLRARTRAGLLAAITAIASPLQADAGADEAAERKKNAAADREAPDRLRVLFIGNSYSHYNDLPAMVDAIAASDPDGARIESELVWIPGATLERLWRLERARSRIREGRYSHVVLQGHSLDTFDHPDALRRFATRFHREARKSGAHTVLYVTWARHRDNPLYIRGEVGTTPAAMQEHITGVYEAIGEELGAAVAPVGPAWRRALSAHPKLRLHRADGSHPTVRGTYLAAAVLYGTLAGVAPTGAEYRPPDMASATARGLRRVAAEALQAHDVLPPADPQIPQEPAKQSGDP